MYYTSCHSDYSIQGIMRAGEWIALAGILATMLVSATSLIVGLYREKRSHEREDKLRQEQRKREDELYQEQLRREKQIREEYRELAPHIEFDIDCNFYGPEEDFYLAEFLLTAHNRGRVRQEFRDILLRVRGIKHNAVLAEWRGNEPRLGFPEYLIKNARVVPKEIRTPQGIVTYNFFFVEPGVKQVFTYISRIPAGVKYIAARGAFFYDPETPHTVERVFQVRASAKPAATIDGEATPREEA